MKGGEGMRLCSLLLTIWQVEVTTVLLTSLPWPPPPPGEAETETPGQWTWWGRMAIEHVGHVAGERRDNILVLSNRI